MSPKMTQAQFADLANRQVGKRYILGAEAKISDPSPVAFDCSEFVEWMFGRNGTPIVDLAAAQYDKCKAVSGTPKPGDLVFLKNNPARWNGIGHVGLITSKLSNGDWRIVEARGRAYGVVKSTLADWKKRAHYAGVRRFPGFALLSNAEEPTPEAKNIDLRVGSYNTQHPSWGGNKNYEADGKFVKNKLRASIFFLQEAGETSRDEIRKVHGFGRWLTWPSGLVSVVWDSAKYAYGPSSAISFGTIAARAQKVQLTSRLNNTSFVACSVHIRPTSVFPKKSTKAQVDAGKLKDVAKLVKFLEKDPNVVVGGDFNTGAHRKAMEAAGYILVTPWVDTNDNPGVQNYDAIYIKGPKMVVRNLFGDKGPGQAFDPGSASDHWGIVANLTLND